MSLFSWLSPRKKPSPEQAESSGLSRMESTKPYSSRGMAPAGGHGQPANRKTERMARRELLYGVVREAMSRAGLLTSNYKFKVLSLDARGRQFLIMVDLAAEAGVEPLRLAEIEALIAQGAKSRHDIIVTAVYWRMNEHVAIGAPRPQARPAVPKGPAVEAAPAAAVSAVAQAATSHSDPMAAEVVAFKRALATGASGAEAIAAAEGASGVPRRAQNYTLLTGFEDTEMASGFANTEIGSGFANTELADPDEPGDLSGTQYGELR